MPQILGTSPEVANRLIPADNLLVSLAEHFDQFLLDWQMSHPSVWRDRIPLGQFPLYSGYSQKSYIFRGTLGPQAGLAEWSPIEPSEKPVGDDSGSDMCTYNPQTYTWAMDGIDFSGLKTSWRSPVFCVNDLKFQDKAQQQLGLIIKAGVSITDQVKETFNRETYVKIAAANGKFVVLCDGSGIDYIDSAATRVTYNPALTDADGDTYIEFDATLLPRISTLNWNQLDIVKQYLADQCPDAAQSNQGGMPIFGLMIDVNDFEKFVLSDSNLREDFRQAIPQRLIEGFNMGFKVYRGIMLMHDLRQMRFSDATITADATPMVHAKRVVPRRRIRPGVVGLIPEANPEYVTAAFGTAILFLNDVCQILIPSEVSSLGSGMSFGPAPDFNGSWSWVNNKSDTNPLGEVGYFFSRYEYFVKMLQYAQEATVFLYRRCMQNPKARCAVDTSSDSATTAVLVDVQPVAADLDVTLRTFSVHLADTLAGGVGDRVTVNTDDGDDCVMYIVEDHAAPLYKLAWKSGETNAPAAIGEVDLLGTLSVQVA